MCKRGLLGRNKQKMPHPLPISTIYTPSKIYRKLDLEFVHARVGLISKNWKLNFQHNRLALLLAVKTGGCHSWIE